MREFIKDMPKEQRQCYRTVNYTKYLNKFNTKWTEQWNKKVHTLFNNKKVISNFQSLYDFDVSIQFAKDFLFELCTHLTVEQTFIRPEDVHNLCIKYESDDKLQLYSDLTVLEICLLISIKHHTEIYDRDPFNFEMILTRYQKFENSTESRMESVDRSIALKSFEHLNVS